MDRCIFIHGSRFLFFLVRTQIIIIFPLNLYEFYFFKHMDVNFALTQTASAASYSTSTLVWDTSNRNSNSVSPKAMTKTDVYPKTKYTTYLKIL